MPNLISSLEFAFLLQQLKNNFLGLVGLIEYSNQFDDFQSPPFHQVLQGQPIVDVDDQGFAAVLVRHSQYVHAHTVDSLVVPIRMQKQPRLVSLHQRGQEPALLVLPRLFVELLYLQESQAVPAPMPLNDRSAMRLVLLPQLVVLVAVQVAGLLEDMHQLLDELRPCLAVGDAQHAPELPHLPEVDFLLLAR